ncbi:MAG: homoserine dehydrogenase [Planctomycetia bacterium]
MHAAGLGHILHDGPLDDDRPAGMPRDVIGRLDEQADDARPDGAQTDDADADRCGQDRNDSRKAEGTSDGTERSSHLEARPAFFGGGSIVPVVSAVAGGIPIVAAIGECLAANRIESIRGILNGTSNFILTRMEEDGADYAEVLKLAQAKGFAEADPSMDVDGTDATQKLAILAHLAFGVWVPWAEIPRTGIDGLDLDLLKYAGELGYRIRLVAVASRSDGRLAMRVAPALVKIGTPLAETRGAYNAVSIVGDAVGRMFFHGLGAGQMPPASAVVADIIDTVVGRAAITFRTTGVLESDTPAAKISDTSAQERHFLRIRVKDQPGVLAKITGTLGEHGISIASVIQHDVPGSSDAGVPLVIMTHACGSAAVQKAVAAIDTCDVVRGRSVCLSVLEE